jgi:hypothetical protein
MSLCVACVLAPFGQPLPWGGAPPMGFVAQLAIIFSNFLCGHSPPAASRRLLAYGIPVYVICFYLFFHYFISSIRPPVLVAFGHPLPFIYFIRWLFLAYFQYHVLYKF